MRCIVHGCPTTYGSSVVVHSVPADPERAVAWLCAVGRLDLISQRRSARVCDLHFGPEHYIPAALCSNTSRNLRKDAIPTKNIPQENNITDSNVKQPTSNVPLPVTTATVTSNASVNPTTSVTRTAKDIIDSEVEEYLLRRRLLLKLPPTDGLFSSGPTIQSGNFSIIQGNNGLYNRINNQATKKHKTLVTKLTSKPITISNISQHTNSLKNATNNRMGTTTTTNSQISYSVPGIKSQSGTSTAVATPTTTTSSNYMINSNDQAISNEKFQLNRLEYQTKRVNSMKKEISQLKRVVKRLQARKQELMLRAQKAERILKTGDISHLDLGDFCKQFMASQIRLHACKKNGQRFTAEDKRFALTLMSTSMKAYRYLSTCFNMPSLRSMRILVSHASLDNQVFKRVLQNLLQKVRPGHPCDKCCTLMFDIMTLNPVAPPEMQKNDSGSVPTIAENVLIFILRGISRKWFVPIGMFFSEATMTSVEIANHVKNMIKEVHTHDIKVVATVCKPTDLNYSAITLLRNQTNGGQQGSSGSRLSFIVDNYEVVPLFDPPNLLKSIRNDLMQYDIEFTTQGVIYIASWKHVTNFYIGDKSEPSCQSCPGLTDAHIDPKDDETVALATQIFSIRVASAMQHVICGAVRHYSLPPEARGTTMLLRFFNNLFDSLNGKHSTNHKPMQGLVSGAHERLWEESAAILKTACLLDGLYRLESTSLTCWVETVNSIRYLWSHMKNNGFKKLYTSSFNMDPLENMFANIRNHVMYKRLPTVSQFVSAFRYFIAYSPIPHCPTSPCEDDGIPSLFVFDDFIQECDETTAACEAISEVVKEEVCMTAEA